MKLYAPDYYKNFRCIAHKCKKSCCVGWEIDIDELTLEKYRSVQGDFGKRLMDSIHSDHGTFSFKLDSRERCPFLNESGLCDIICHLGDGYLSQICTDHPRFRNFYSDRTEIGLGLCCEEACRLILNNKQKTRLIPIEDDGCEEELTDDENFLLDIRSRLFDIVQDREVPIVKRAENLLTFLDTSFPPHTALEWVRILESMEIMDECWGRILKDFKGSHGDSLKEVIEIFSTEAEQLLVYFLYRYIADAEDIDDLAARGRFAVVSVWTIFNIFAEKGALNTEALAEICRLYSSEIEYSEENTENILELLRP